MLNLIYAAVVEHMTTENRESFDDSLIERDPVTDRERRLAFVQSLGGEVALA